MEPEVRNLPSSDFSKHRVRRSNGEVTIDGLYAEKSPGRFMVRVRVTGGRLDLDQALALADLADRHADGQWHVDTRQNVELHGVPEADVLPLLEALERHGLTTRGACGDTVRNIVVGGEAGRFSRGGPDLYALADALTARFAGKPEFETLPRKFKTGLFSADDREPLYRVQDLAFVEERRDDGAWTFSAWAGGGLGREPRLADLLFTGVPASALGDLMEALVRVHHDYSDRKNRARARFKFVAQDLGVERVRELVLQLWSAPTGVNLCPVLSDNHSGGAALAPSGIQIQADGRAALAPSGIQIQADGRARVAVPLIAGDIETRDVRALVAAARRHGASGLLLGVRQNMALPDVPAENVPALEAELAALGFAPSGWGGPRDIVACPGSDQCRKAFVETRNFAHELASALEAIDVPDQARRLRIGLAGCPNSCTHPHLNDLGFRGAVGVVEGKKRQGFDFLLAGRVLGGTRLGVEAARYLDQDEVIAVSVAAAKTLATFGAQGEEFSALVARLGLRFVARRIADNVKLTYGHWTELARLPAPAPESGLAVLNAALEESSPREILEWAVHTYGEKLLVTTALNAGGVLLMRYLREIAPEHPVYFVDTGKHFAETLEYRDRLVRDFGFNIVTLGPDLPEDEFADRHGRELWQNDADLCCFLRKVLPLQRVRRGKLAWVSALRREQGGERADLGCLSCDTEGLLRVQPLIALSREVLDAELELLGIPQHPLRERGYTSIGCSPCTVAPQSGLGERAGRWAGTRKTECGLHRFDKSTDKLPQTTGVFP